MLGYPGSKGFFFLRWNEHCSVVLLKWGLATVPLALLIPSEFSFQFPKYLVQSQLPQGLTCHSTAQHLVLSWLLAWNTSPTWAVMLLIPAQTCKSSPNLTSWDLAWPIPSFQESMIFHETWALPIMSLCSRPQQCPLGTAAWHLAANMTHPRLPCWPKIGCPRGLALLPGTLERTRQHCKSLGWSLPALGQCSSRSK